MWKRTSTSKNSQHYFLKGNVRFKGSKNPVWKLTSIRKNSDTSYFFRLKLGLRTHHAWISNSLQPKFISQTQIDFSLKCLKSLVFCRNNDWLIDWKSWTRDEMRFQLEIHTPNTPQSIQPISPNELSDHVIFWNQCQRMAWKFRGCMN